jgi:hypothetical protein
MTYARDGNIPYWLSTMPILGLDDGTPRAAIRITLPDDTLPFPYVLPFPPPPAPPPGGWPQVARRGPQLRTWPHILLHGPRPLSRLCRRTNISTPPNTGAHRQCVRRCLRRRPPMASMSRRYRWRQVGTRCRRHRPITPHRVFPNRRAHHPGTRPYRRSNISTWPDTGPLRRHYHRLRTSRLPLRHRLGSRQLDGSRRTPRQDFRSPARTMHREAIPRRTILG